MITLGLFTWALASGRPLAEAMTMTFASLVLIEFFKAYSFRSDRHSVLEGLFANKWLNLAIVWELLMLAAGDQRPVPAGCVRHDGPLGRRSGSRVAGLAFLIVPVLETAKWLIRRGSFGELPPA